VTSDDDRVDEGLRRGDLHTASAQCLHLSECFISFNPRLAVITLHPKLSGAVYCNTLLISHAKLQLNYLLLKSLLSYPQSHLLLFVFKFALP